MPYANKKLRKLKIDFKSNYTNLLISPGIFENLNKLTIYVKERKSSNDILGVLIYDNSNRDYSTTITAKSGTISQDDNSALLYLKEGTAQRFNHETRKSDILHFDSYVVNLKEGQKQTTMKRWKASERYIGELLNPGEDISDLEVRRYAVELHQRMTYPLLSIVLALIACAFILSGKFTRSGNLIHNVKEVASAATFIGLIMFSYDTAEKNLALIPLIYAPLLFFVVMSLSKLKSK
jgi:lipopolysaccharide export LptBFGC system permease protein LptF